MHTLPASVTPRASSSEASHYCSRRCFLASCRMVSQHFPTCLARTVKTLHGVELLLLGAPGCPNVVCFSFSNIKWYVVGFGFSLLLPVHHESLRLSQPNNITERQYARIHRAASDMLLVTCKWRYGCRFWLSVVSVVFRVVRSAFDCVCVSHVSGWLRLIEVFAKVPLGVSCFLSCRVRVILCGPLERWGPGRLFHRGNRLQAAVASCAHLSCSGGREPVA